MSIDSFAGKELRGVNSWEFGQGLETSERFMGAKTNSGYSSLTIRRRLQAKTGSVQMGFSIGNPVEPLDPQTAIDTALSLVGQYGEVVDAGISEGAMVCTGCQVSITPDHIGGVHTASVTLNFVEGIEPTQSKRITISTLGG